MNAPDLTNRGFIWEEVYNLWWSLIGGNTVEENNILKTKFAQYQHT